MKSQQLFDDSAFDESYLTTPPRIQSDNQVRVNTEAIHNTALRDTYKREMDAAITAVNIGPGDEASTNDLHNHLKILERILDIQSKMEVKPFFKSQHAHLKGKSTETTLHD